MSQLQFLHSRPHFSLISLGVTALFTVFFVNSLVRMPAGADTTPNVTNVSGTITHGETVTITGSGFGTKASAAPNVYDPMDTSLSSQWASTHDLSLATDNLRHPHSLGAGFVDMIDGNHDSGHVQAKNTPLSDTWFAQYWVYFADDFDFGTSGYEGPDRFLANMKFFRLWNPGSVDENFVLAYLGDSNAFLYNVEYINPDQGTYIPGSARGRLTKGEWHQFQFAFKENSTPGASDGQFWMWMDGELLAQRTTLETREDYAQLKRPYILGWDSVHGPGSGEDPQAPNSYYIDDVYLDTSWARVELGNAATYAASTHREIQVPSSWSDTAIEITVQPGSFVEDETAYVYVIDENGNVNAEGIPVVIGQEGVATPRIYSVSDSWPEDGDTFLIQGSGFGAQTLDTEWLGGENGPIENTTTGQVLSRTNWDFDITQGGFQTPVVDNSKAHSYTKSIRSFVTGSQWGSGFGYGPGEAIEDIYATWWVYPDIEGGGSGGNPQWKVWRLNYQRNYGDHAGSLYHTKFWDIDHNPGQHILHLFADENHSNYIGYPDGDGDNRWLDIVDIELRAWTKFEVYAKASSAAGVRDGTLIIRELEPGSPPRTIVEWQGNIITRLNEDEPWNWLLFQNFLGDGFLNPEVWIDDVYLQFGGQYRVEIANAPVYVDATHREIQPPSSWTDTTIQVTVNRAGFAPDEELYLYVLDANGVASDGYLLQDDNLAPILSPIGNKSIHEQEVLNFTVLATDANDDSLSLSATNLPAGASFTDHEDGTGTFTWTPTASQSGSYPDIHFEVSDGTLTDTEDITITVEDGTADCSPNWSCTPWSTCSNSSQTRTCTDQNACGTDAGKPATVQACDSTAPGRIVNLESI